MSHYKPYPAYRDSGIEWLGQVPEHWATLRLANIGPLEKGNGGTKEDDADNGMPCVRYGDLYTTYDFLIRKVRKFIRPERACDYTPIKYGDLLFAASGETFEEIGKSAVNLTESIACCGGDVIVLRPEREVNPVFLAYAAGSISAQAQKSLMGKGFTVIHIYGNALRDLVIATPTAREQELIGVAIERECARIDTLIAKKNRFIELLKEKRQALITHAVTKGLNPDAKMKTSGRQWIGNVPSQWGVARIKHVARLESGHTPSRKVPEYWENCSVPWFTLGDIWQVRKEGRKTIVDTSEKVSELGLANSSARKLPSGTVVLSRTASVGFPAILGKEMATSQDFAAWICGPRLYNEFLYYCLVAMRPELERLMIGSTHKTIYMPDIEEFQCPLPPVGEQKEIVSYIETQLGRIAALVHKTKRTIDLLKERRSAFITAAVTGQIDLREAA